MSEDDFSSLYPLVYDFIQQYVESFVAHERLENTLEDYGDFEKSIVYQLDFIQENGGVRVFNGDSGMDIESITCSGYTLKTGNDIIKFQGIPISPLLPMAVKKELRKKGYLKRCVI